MKKYALLILLVFSTLLIAQSENYKKVKIYFNSKLELIDLLQSRLNIDHYSIEKDKSIIVYLSDSKFELLKETGYRYLVEIDDWKKYYNEKSSMSEAEKQQNLNKMKTARNITSFDYGSMGGYYTFPEVVDILDKMRSDFPNLISEKFSIGKTIEGRDQWVVKISDNPEQDEDEPEIFFNALIHAREPAGMMSIMYYMFYLLENYGVDPSVTYLVDNREIYFLPVINVDGYEYNRSTDPDGGGMWRKNRKKNSDNSMGIDLNRNWGYEWGYNDTGSSPYPSDETYRGTAPFSEPETENIRQFVNSRNFKAALNYHTYSNLLITPWGYVGKETPDSLVFREFASDMTQFNGYTWGISEDIIYETNGDSDDWMYGEQTDKSKIISMTPEVGNGNDGFWPSQDRIYPLVEENLFPNLYLTWAAGDYVSISNEKISSEIINPGDDFTITPSIKNKGLVDALNISVKIESISQFISVSDNIISIDSISARTEISDSGAFLVSVDNEAPIGEDYGVVITVSSGDVKMSTDTIRFFAGTPKEIFSDRADLLSLNWQTTSNNAKKWAVTSSNYFSSPTSFTESVNSEYLNNSHVTMKSKSPIDLSGIAHPRLSFRSKWNIESSWDCGQVKISTNGGANWYVLTGNYTKPGAGQGTQPLNSPVYDGMVNNWVREDIDLTPFSGESVMLMFDFSSDEWVTYDGWYIDDIMIYHYGDESVSVKDNSAAELKFGLDQNYPNPFNPSTIINYSIAEQGFVSLKIYNMLGEEIAVLVNEIQNAGRHEIILDTSKLGFKLSSGVYIYTLKSASRISSRKMLFVK